MKREEMRKKINEELRHIPRSFRGSNQNWLREYYNGMPMTDLSQNSASPAKDTLIKATEQVKKTNLEFSPLYDKGFFEKDV